MNTAIVYLQTTARQPGLPPRQHIVAVTVSIEDPNTAYTEGCRLAMETIPAADRVNWEVNLGETFLAAQTVIAIKS